MSRTRFAAPATAATAATDNAVTRSPVNTQRTLPGRLRRAAVLGAVAVGLLSATALPAVADGSHSPDNGSGSSWSANAINQWIADVSSNGLQVSFTGSGSAVGRKDFAQKTTDFGITDIGYQGTDPNSGESDDAGGRAYAYLPIVAGGTAFPYHVERAGQLVKNIRLSGDTLAKIFTNQISDWNDPAITKDNNGVALPDLQIIPVVHQEGSGSSAQFSAYLAKQYPQYWTSFNGGHDTLNEYYPRQGAAVAQNGSDGVMNYVASAAANGAIGFDEYSYALGKNYPVAKIENAKGIYTLPTQYNVAVALTHAAINNDPNSPNYLLQDLSAVYVAPETQVYPLSSYSYMLLPTGTDAQDTTLTTGKRQTLADYLSYSLCQGQKEMGPIGYSPLPVNLVKASFMQTQKLNAADPGVDVTNQDVSKCNNPTFDPSNPNGNYLATIAPVPPACDQNGMGPCGGPGDSGTGNASNGGAAPAPVNSAAASAAAGGTGSTAKTATTGKTGTTAVKPVTTTAKTGTTTNKPGTTATGKTGAATSTAGTTGTTTGTAGATTAATGTGTAVASTTGGGTTAVTGAGTVAGTTAGTTGASTAVNGSVSGATAGQAVGAPAATTIDPVTGAVTTLAGGATANTAAVSSNDVAAPTIGSPTLVANPSSSLTGVLGPLAALEFLAVVIIPPFLVRYVRNRAGSNGTGA